MHKLTLIIALFLAVVGVGGGSYYYYAIFQPRAYAASTLSLYAKLETAGLQPDASSLRDGSDYEGALRVLDERTALLELTQRELARQAVPKRMENFHKVFSGYVDFTLVRHARAASLASFLKTGSELRDVLKQIYALGDFERDKIKTLGDAARWWGERIPRARTFADEFFREEIAGLSDPSFAELRALWKEGSPALDIVFDRIQSANPRLSVLQFGTVLTSADVKRLEGSSKKLEEFLKRLDVLLDRHSAYDTLAFRDVPDVFPAEASERALQLYQTMRELREIYGR